jgi:hypothetical protein
MKNKDLVEKRTKMKIPKDKKKKTRQAKREGHTSESRRCWSLTCVMFMFTSPFLCLKKTTKDGQSVLSKKKSRTRVSDLNSLSF